MAELKNFLRQQDFPLCASSALAHLVDVVCTPQSKSTHQQRLIQEIVDEFIFCEIDRRGISTKRLNAIQELHLVELLADFFGSQRNEVHRNTMLLTLFQPGNDKNKMVILHKLVSVAIATANTIILNSTSVWMQQQGCTSDMVVDVVHNLVVDYCLLAPNSTDFLRRLPDVSLQFAAQFTTASTTLIQKKDKLSQPLHEDIPFILLDLICCWICANPQLCLVPVLTDWQSCLPRGNIAMPSVLPLAGLIFILVEYSLKPCASESEGSLLSLLHLALLETMINAKKLRGQIKQREIIPWRELRSMCEVVSSMVATKSADEERVGLALDRLGQALQVAMKSSCTQANRDELTALVRKMPENRLLKIVTEAS